MRFLIILLFAFTAQAQASERAIMFEVSYKLGSSSAAFGVRADVDKNQISASIGDGFELGIGRNADVKRSVTYYPGVVFNTKHGWAMSNRAQYNKRDGIGAIDFRLGKNSGVLVSAGMNAEELFKDNSFKSH